VFVVILYRYPAGLLVYWITTNLWTIAQQYLIKRAIGPPPAPVDGKGATDGKPTRSLKPALAGAGAGVASSPGSGASAADPAPAPAKGSGRRPSRENHEKTGASNGKAAAPPPRPPRKKKKRSGRRR
jgi:YidC/Oxa1 family membrane protein insertase